MSTRNTRKPMSKEKIEREAKAAAAAFARTRSMGFGGEGSEMSQEDKAKIDIKLEKMMYTEGCEAINHVNDDGSIDCPKSRSKARAKLIHFHSDKNKKCVDYATQKMVEYNNNCYGDGDFEYNEDTGEWGEKRNKEFKDRHG